MKVFRLHSLALDLRINGAAAIALLISGCGSGGNSAPAQTSTPTPTPSIFAVTSPAANALLGATNIASVTIAGNCDSNAASVAISGAVTASASCVSTHWTTQANFSAVIDGSASITATESVSSGTAPTAITVAFTKDTIAPVVAFLQPAANSIIDPNNISVVPVNGTCNENTRTVALSANSGAVTASATCSSGAWSTTLNLSTLTDGLVSLTASHTDAAGNIGTTSRLLNKASVSVRANQTIAGFPHTIDYYIPSNAQSVMIFMHGGGGNKEMVANDLGIKNDDTASNYTVSASGIAWLVNQRVAVVVPQGQVLPGYLANTWSNYFMDSGVNDVAFLQGLAAAIRSDATLSGVTKIFLSGHSNGGIMTNRMWCESPTTFDGFGALSGPPSLHLDPTLAASATNHPCAPSTVKPYLGIVGDSDEVFQTAGNMSAKYWFLRPAMRAGPPTFLDTIPTALNDKVFHTTRVTMKCASAPTTPTVNGQITTYSDCSATIKTLVVAQAIVNGVPSGGGHCINIHTSGCTTTLAGDTGLDYKTALMDFFHTL